MHTLLGVCEAALPVVAGELEGVGDAGRVGRQLRLELCAQQPPQPYSAYEYVIRDTSRRHLHKQLSSYSGESRP